MPPDIAHLPQLQPLDEHNRTLRDHVHPPQWTNPTPRGRYHLLVIGGGPAGLVAAAGAAGLGARVALVEKHLLGGDCLNVGCVPSKALLRCARAAAEARRADRFGVRVGGVEVDFAAVMERMRRLRAELSHHDSAARFRELGVDVFLGEGRFTSPHTFEIGGQTIRFSRACIATGARAAKLPIPGLDEVEALTNETVFSLTALPARLAVIGAGPIGCELAQAFARFGSQVTLFEAMPHILPREDQDAAMVVAQALMADGVTIRCGREPCPAKIVRLARRGDERVVHIETPDGTEELVVDQVLVGVGRAPNVEGLGLEAAGVEYDRSGIRVDEHLRTTARHIFAAGDVCSQYRFTHAADAMARIVIANALFFGRGKATALTIPWCTYTDPEIAHVGLYPQQAAERGIAIDTFRIDFSQVDRAVLDGSTEGFVKVHVRKGSDRIVGATIVGPHAGDLISEISVAMAGGVGLGRLSSVIHPYPTLAEAIKKAADAYRRTKLTPFAKKLLGLMLRLHG